MYVDELKVIGEREEMFQNRYKPLKELVMISVRHQDL